MCRFKMVIAYDGSAFHGYAKQPNLPSVQGALECALQGLGITSPLLCAGRTDKGVHALAQVVSFCASLSLQTLQRHLPPKITPHIACKHIESVPLDFHPRFYATMRTYCYVFTKALHNPFLSRYIACCDYGDLVRLQEALDCFVGMHDFKFFSKQSGDFRNTQRQIYRAKCRTRTLWGVPCVLLYISAPSFLRAQVRLIVGAALAYSLGHLSLAQLQAQIHAQYRYHNIPAPPQGLYLARVDYPRHGSS
ncbi:tRNA pseudouridine(38-40) synthase TruA [Helicobacter baculiformis]|uniref:tRNA pseudouridine synthase A n=1 Tax=Helicobacter baculiformis TaxID=427351 RepID=A0ABV7ZHF9_9HELI|nr:tRNA pseudouridine(38-40) synthase TruA [Helicobacter baculiformis]